MGVLTGLCTFDLLSYFSNQYYLPHSYIYGSRACAFARLALNNEKIEKHINNSQLFIAKF